MNKILLIPALIIMVANLTGCMVYIPGAGRHRPLHQEQGSQEINVGVGGESGTNLVADFGNSGDLHHLTNYNTGSLVAGYKYYVSDRVALGPVAGFQNFSYKWMNDAIAYNQPVYTQTTSLITLAAELKGIITSSKYFQFYNLLGAGGTFHFDQFSPARYNQYVYNSAPPNSNYVAFNFQYSIGLQTGNTFCWFLEFGLGYKGIAHTGFTYKIPAKHPHSRTNARRYY